MPDAQFELVIYDLDGTLIDSKLDLAHAVNATRAHMRLGPLDHELIYSYVGNGAPVLIRRALGADAPEETVEAALQYFLAYYHEHKLDYTRLYPGVEEALETISKTGAKQAVLTNKPVNISRAIIHGLGVSEYFFRVYGGNSFEQKKPHPAGIDALLEESGASRARAMMVGDSGVDIQTARNARVACVGCTWGFQPESLLIDPPDWTIENMTELAAIVQPGPNGII
jgi:phosphoglycolate phosphatase